MGVQLALSAGQLIMAGAELPLAPGSCPAPREADSMCECPFPGWFPHGLRAGPWDMAHRVETVAGPRSPAALKTWLLGGGQLSSELVVPWLCAEMTESVG